MWLLSAIIVAILLGWLVESFAPPAMRRPLDLVIVLAVVVTALRQFHLLDRW